MIGLWLKVIAGLALLVAAIVWSVYFYTHPDTVCHNILFAHTKECIGWNLSRLTLR